MTRKLPASAAFAAIAAAAISLASPALAAPAELTWRDLDLATDAGKTELDARITKIARELCRVDAQTGSHLRTRNLGTRCINEARARIAAQVAQRIEQTGRGG